MNLTKITLENFRNYTKAEVEINSNLVLILGENAAGKTNFLESIYFLSNLKSFRTPDNLLTRRGEDFFKITGESGEEKLEAVVQTAPVFKRQFKINGQKIPRVNWKSFTTVLFAPHDLNLFSLGPAMRRKFLNDVLAQSDKLYSVDHASLEHILKQKSALLDRIGKNLAKSYELEFWYKELSSVGFRISKHRRNFLKFVSAEFQKVYTEIAGFDSSFSIEYTGLEEGMDEQSYLARIKEYEQAEIRSGQNLIGPHRDDFLIFKDNQPNIHNSSRGELRSQILALKLLQARFLSDKESQAVILLDDVFSELDETRRAKLLESLKGHQIFITTTEEHHLPKLKKDAQIVNVKDGGIVMSK